MAEPLKIQTRPFKPNEKEGNWPPRRDVGEIDSVPMYWDSEALCMKPGYPQPKEKKFGKAPYVIQDSIPAYYHPGACRTTESRSELNQMDRATGSITTDKKLPPNPSNQNRLNEERRRDAREALNRSVAQIDSGTAPMTEETREMCKKENERLANVTQWDTFNVAGRKNDRRGKKYRKR